MRKKRYGNERLTVLSSLMYINSAEIWSDLLKCYEKDLPLRIEIGCGKVLSGRIDTQNEVPASRTVLLRPQRVNHILGTDYPEEVIVECLMREGIKVLEMDEDGALICAIPAYRMDLAIEEDLIEEDIAHEH